MIIIDDNNVCDACGAYLNDVGYCSNGHNIDIMGHTTLEEFNNIDHSWPPNLIQQMAEVQPIHEELVQDGSFAETDGENNNNVAIGYSAGVNMATGNTNVAIGYSSQEIIDTGYVYAPYIPLHVSPTLTLNVSELKDRISSPKLFEIKKYKIVYTDIKNRFELLDL